MDGFDDFGKKLENAGKKFFKRPKSLLILQNYL